MAETRENLQIQREEGGAKVEDNRVKAQSEFTVADVTSALETYVATLREDTAVKIALTSHSPKVQGFVITLEVDNDFLLSKVTDIHPYLLSFLAKRLNNGFITLNVKFTWNRKMARKKDGFLRLRINSIILSRLILL